MPGWWPRLPGYPVPRPYLPVLRISRLPFPPLVMTPSLVMLTDFHAVTNRALSYAAGLAVPLQAHLLHVRHDPNFIGHMYRTATEQVLQNTPDAERSELLIAPNKAM